jgi:hypothetical protein
MGYLDANAGGILSEEKPDRPNVRDELRTPLQIDNRMEWILFYIRKATRAIGDPETGYRKQFLDAKDAYERAHKQSKLDDEQGGTVGDREDRAQLANWELYKAMKQAEQVLKYAQEKKADLEGELSKCQSETKLIIKEMELAGRGGI